MGPEGTQPLIWSFKDYELDELKREFRGNGTRLPLEAKPFDVLRVLVLHAGQVMTRDQLCDAVWPGISGSDASLTTAISKIRSVLGVNARMVLNVPGVGYKFAEQVHAVVVAAPGSSKTNDLREGDTVPGRQQWRLNKKLGESPGSAVWLCLHVKTSEPRVFKFAFDNSRLLRLQREVAVSRLLSRLVEPKAPLLRVLEWNFDSLPYFVESEYGGENLVQWSESRGGPAQLPLAERLAMMAAIAQAVATAHNVGVIHKDLKPANILVSATGTIRVSDFDLAWVTEPERLEILQITNPGFATSSQSASSPIGTMLYVAPEVLRGQAPSMASDVYALGVILYQLVSGDFRNKLTAGWEREIDDALLREDIRSTANGSPDQRPSAAALAQSLLTLEERRTRRKEIEEIQLRSQVAERRLAAAKARRPWVTATVVALLLGCVISFSLFYRAVRERDRANREVARESALNRFVSADVLGQTDPFLNGSAHESLEEAVMRASPNIDREFANDFATAGSLHCELARALEARSSQTEAQDEYKRAIELFRRSGVAGKEDAIRAIFQQAAMEARWFQPGTLQSAHTLLAQGESEQSKLGAKASPGLEVWHLSALGAIAIVEANPRKAATNYATAIRNAEAIEGFAPSDIQGLKGYLAIAYVRIPDGASAERLCREMLREAASRNEANSAAALRIHTWLIASLYVQGKYSSLIQDADSVYPLLAAKVGPDNDACVKLLGSRAAAAGHLGLWDRAVRDDLAIYETLLRKQGAISFLSLATLSDAGLSQCRSGLYTVGEKNTRKAYEESKQLPKQTGVTDAISYALAYCLIGESRLNEASDYLKRIDVEAVVHLTGESSVAGDIALAQGEIALRRHDYRLAGQCADEVSKAFANANVDALDWQELAHLRQSVKNHHS